MAAKVLQRLDILLFANTAQYRSEMRDTQQSTTTMMAAIKADAANMAKVGAAAFAGMAAAGTAAIGVMIKEQTELANEIVKLAKVSNTNIDVMQKHIVAARAMGVEQETLGDIYKDTQDKIGDFLTTGGGAMADFFDSMPANVNMTAESFRKLSGPEALQRYYNGLQEANLSNAELIFHMEGMASDASLLIPLLHDNGAGFDVWAEAAENAGVIMDEKTIASTQTLTAANDLLNLSVEGAKTQFTSAFIPVLADVADELVGTAGAADLARDMGEGLVVGFKGVAKVGIGVAAVFDVVGSSIGGVAATIGSMLNGVDIMDSVWVTSLKIAKNFGSANEIARLADQDISASLSSYSEQFEFIDNLGNGKRESRFLTAAKQQEELRRQLGLTGQAVQANAAAEEEAAKAAEKAAKASQKSAAAAVKNIQAQAVNSKVLEQAKQFNYGNLEREYGLPAGLLSAVSMQESRGNANARSPVGASGAFQFMPGTADRFGIRGQESNVGKSAEAAAKYLSFLMNKFGSVDLALAGYNAGEGNVAKYGNKIPPFKETQEYVKKVNGYLAFMKGGLDGSVNIAGNIASQTAIIEREAAEQVRILEQQAKDRVAIRLEYSDEATRIEEQLKTKILQISASGFSDNERDAFIADAIDIANEKLAQMQLVHDQEMQYAQQAEQTDAERIRNQYELERREIQLTVNMDEQLRTAKIDALNQAEQLALDERRYAYERELRDLTSIGQSSLASLRQTYTDQRRALDQRTDIDDGQKSSLRDAMAGAQIYDTNQLQTAARDPFNAQQADMSGMGASYGLAQQYQSRLDVIQEALDAEVIAVEQAEQAKYAARYEFEAAATQLTLSQAEATAGGLAASFKTMLGEQNTAYKLLFAGQQAFVMASAGLNMWDAYGDAMAEGATMSQKFAAAATIATEFGRIITAASSMTLELPGYQTGGYTGDGGLSDVAGLVHKEEFVSNASTTKRYRPELEAMHNGTYEKETSSTGAINVNVNITSDGRSSIESDNKIGRDLGNVIGAAVKQHIIKEQRQGGLLYRR